MVVIHCKRLPKEEHSKDYDEFLYSTPGTNNVGDVTTIVTNIQNTRVRVKWMVAAANELAKDYAAEQHQHLLRGAAEEGAKYLDIRRCTEGKLPSSMEELEAIAKNLKGAVMIAFPDLCSGTDVLRRLATVLDAESTDEKTRGCVHRVLSILDDGATTDDILPANGTVMWFGGKALNNKAGTFAEIVGKNDKTKLVVKLSKEGGNAPPREQGLDPQTQAEMMAYWHRKQEEAKKLVEDEDISYGNSEWADPQGLKKQFLGMGNVSYRGGR